jgi:hypothetical protein
MTLKIGVDRASKRGTPVESPPELSHQLLLFRPHNTLSHRSVCRDRTFFFCFFTDSGYRPLSLILAASFASIATPDLAPSPFPAALRSVDEMLRSGQAMKAMKALAQRQPCHARALTTSSTISKVTTTQQKVPATTRNKATSAAA